MRYIITGCSCTLGKELVLKFSECKDNYVYGLDIDEKESASLRDMCKYRDNVEIHIECASNIFNVISGDGVEVVLHLAASKDIVKCEENKKEAYHNNIVSLEKMLEFAVEYNIPKFVFTSSDKAANPIGYMGKLKKKGEELISCFAENNDLCFYSLRLGNVLGSSGSIIPVLKENVSKDVPIKITHTNMTRYIMTNSMFLYFLESSLSLSRGGEVMCLKMPKIKITDLINSFLAINGINDYPIIVSGVRKNEKLYEDLYDNSEINFVHLIDGIYVLNGIKGHFGQGIYREEFSSKYGPYLGVNEIMDYISSLSYM